MGIRIHVRSTCGTVYCLCMCTYCMYMYMYMYIYVHVCTCICRYNTCMYMYMYVHVHNSLVIEFHRYSTCGTVPHVLYVHVRMCVCTCTYMYMQIQCTYMYVYTLIRYATLVIEFHGYSTRYDQMRFVMPTCVHVHVHIVCIIMACLVCCFWHYMCGMSNGHTLYAYTVHQCPFMCIIMYICTCIMYV